MRFDLYPLDSHVCKFQVGSTNLDITRMKFSETDFKYDPTSRNTILDYAVSVNKLSEEDRILPYGEIGNYSITGIEIHFTRHKLKYMYMYYLPSGKIFCDMWREHSIYSHRKNISLNQLFSNLFSK